MILRLEWSVLIRLAANETLLAMAPKYHKAILEPDDKTFPRLECPSITHGRYDYMRSKSWDTPFGKRKYFFALNLHDSIDIIPRLLGSIIETMRFLGLDQCTLSIIEGRSTDGTYEVLNSLKTELEKVGATYYFSSSNSNPEDGDRIKKLASLRNDALQPLKYAKGQAYQDATIIFLNDVAICKEDILELIHQRLNLDADMVCGMDWKNLWKDPTFYDVWIARTITGDSFFQVGADGNWDSAWDLFWSDEKTKQRFDARQPFQVFSCWNGGAVFSARPLFRAGLKFRAPYDGECFNGEPALFCKDMWWLGYRKIAVVPTVNLEYTDQGARDIRALKGSPSKNPPVGGDESLRFEWQKEPPPQVRCVTNYHQQTWGAWNESMPVATIHT